MNPDPRITQCIEQWVAEPIRALKPYTVQPAAGLIKLDAMENPYRCDANWQQRWLQHLAQAQINRYPDPHSHTTRAALKRWWAIAEPYDIVLGNGSDEIIQLLIMLIAQQGGGVLAPQPSFVMYAMIARYLSTPFIGVPLTDHFELDLPAMLQAIAQHRPALIFLAQPNNPTGNLFAPQQLQQIIEQAPGLVVIDEAYTAFTQTNCLPWLQHYPNVLIMRTLSKMGLAGLRLGMLIGHTQWLEQVNKLRLPYNINVLTQLSAEFAIEHRHSLQAQIDQLKQQRQWLYQQLRALAPLQVFPSEANFFLVRLSLPYTADQVHAHLKDRGILVKNLHGSHPLLDQCLRINVSCADELQPLLQALQQLFACPL